MLNPSEQSLFVAGLKVFAEDVFQNEIKKGFQVDEDKEYFIKNELGILESVDLSKVFSARRISLIHSEVSELLESTRKLGMDEHCPEFTNEEIEAADILIRLMTYCGRRNLRIMEAALAKTEFNESRPYLHNKGF
jgi:hypothetical protein